MKIHNRTITAREAAEYFANHFQEEPRKVGCVVNAPEYGIQFQLVGGTAWYSVKGLPNYSGWEVTRDGQN